MDVRGLIVGVVASLALAGCGEADGYPSQDDAFTLPVGPTEWDVSAPAWFYAGTLHVGEQMVELGEDVDLFVLGATGVYWTRSGTLMFTSAEGTTRRVADVGWNNLAVSANRSVFATVDQSRGPTDDYGTHVMQVAAFDTRTGEQLYRTPDQEPDEGDDLADLHGEIMPLLHGVSDERLFYDQTTINLSDGSAVPAVRDADHIEVYEGYAETLFPDGYHVSIRGDGPRRTVAQSSIYATGLLSPDRSTIFDTSIWPTPAVAYDSTTGRRQPIAAPWRHFTLAGWSDESTFFGVAERIDESADNVLRARQVVTCVLHTLACTPLSAIARTEDQGQPSSLLVEGLKNPF